MAGRLHPSLPATATVLLVILFLGFERGWVYRIARYLFGWLRAMGYNPTSGTVAG